MTTTTEPTSAAEVPTPAGTVQVASRTPFELFWARFKEDKVALFGGIVIVLLIVIALIGGPIAAQATVGAVRVLMPDMASMWGEPALVG